jgi:hypothetical protein
MARDVMAGLGAVLVSAGAALAWPPAGLIVGGLLLLAGALAWGAARGRR